MGVSQFQIGRSSGLRSTARDPGTGLAARVSPEHEKETMKGN